MGAAPVTVPPEEARLPPLGAMMASEEIRVMVVEDDRQFGRSVQRMLTGAGFLAEHVVSAEAARNLIASQVFDLAICDLGLPGDGGLVLARELQLTRPELAVIIATGLDTTSSMEEAFGYGAYDYLVKPFTEAELVLAVSKALRRSRARSSGGDEAEG